MSALAVDSLEIETLVYERLDGRDRGWRAELLVEQLTNKLEQKFLLCGCCSGLARDACLLEKEGKQELRCFVCIPEGVTWQPAEMNRDAINEKIIVCPLSERGCEWRDTVSRGIEHVKECEFLPILCPLKCVECGGGRIGEVVRVERRLMAEHEREYCPQRELRCEFCGRGVRACEMNPHLGECSEFPVDCPNGCSVAEETGTRQVKRGDVPLHLASCQLQTVKCPYWEYGCGEEMERRQLDLHERDSMHIHFNLAMKEMKRNQTESNNKILSLEKLNTELTNELKQNKNEMKSQLIQANDRIQYLEETVSTGRLEWKIQGVKDKIEKKVDTFSDPFHVGLYKCQGKIVWDFNNTGRVVCFICIMKGEFDDKLKWPFIYRYKFVLLNQNRSEDDYIWSGEITKADLQLYPECFQRPTEINNDGIGNSLISHTAILEEKYCKEDSISLHITVEQLPSFYP